MLFTVLTALLAVIALTTVTTAAADPNVDAKRAQAQDVLAQIQDMDAELGLAIEEYNHANVKLDKIQADLKANAKHLTIAKSSLKNAQAHLASRLVSLYVGGSETSALEVVLGAESLDDLLNRLETVERVSEQDTRVLAEVRGFRTEVVQRKSKLKRAQAAQKQVVAARAAQRASIESRIAQRQRMLASIKSEIAAIQAAERRREARLAAQARARFQAQQATASAPAPRSVTAEASVQEVLTPSEPTAAAPDARYGGVVGIAMQYLGVPYKWGGADPSTGFDCSGFSMYVYAKVGVSLPHHAATQFGMGTPVSLSELQPGDLVFFHGLGHMGIYIGNDSFIHAPRTGDVVKISQISGWYANRFVGARRIT